MSQPRRDPFVPIYLGKTREEIVVDYINVWPTPWNPPALIYATAHSAADPDQEHIVISGELPFQSWIGCGALSKAELERRHLARYVGDYQLGTGSDPWDGWRQGPDPPDWLCSVDGTESGVDSAQFTIQALRHVQDLVRKMKATIVELDASNLSHLAGHCVYFWVYDVEADTMNLPPKTRSLGEIESLLAGLSKYRVDTSPTLPTGVPLADAIPIEFGESSAGCLFFATPFQGGLPESEFFAQTGFELGYVYPVWHGRSDALKILSKLVSDHDNPAIDELLITAGGPDRSGMRYVSDEAMLLFLLEKPESLALQIRHLKRIRAHLWSTGAIYELQPVVKRIWAGVPPASV